MNKVYIIGVGLIGGSLALDIKKLWVYSSNAMDILDSSLVQADRLYAPPSVWVDSIRWKKLTRFDP